MTMLGRNFDAIYNCLSLMVAVIVEDLIKALLFSYKFYVTRICTIIYATNDFH